MEARFLWHDYRYFPYERDLARREIKAILHGQIRDDQILEERDGLSISVSSEQTDALKRLTYFKGIEIEEQVIVPDQAKLEASALVKGQKWIPETQLFPFPSLRRQSTRYSAHGLHEYRGKFNPQVVRAIGNMTGLKPGSWVLDPFCGSGTTLLESAHIGWNALGFDVNPLGVMIANAKVIAFRTAAHELREYATNLQRVLRSTVGNDWETYLPNSEYLAQWFTVPVLNDFACILKSIELAVAPELRIVFHVILSDICRDVSLQDPGDLRIRRRKEPYPEFNALQAYLSALDSKIETICSAVVYADKNQAVQLAIYADSRHYNDHAVAFLKSNGCQFLDGAITSPPYATALPYVDTQRLSLCLLGLLKSDEIRSAERSLIGNREISTLERSTLEDQIKNNVACLPPEVAQFCSRLLEMADHDCHGFRRRNVPALVYKYFVQMAETFQAVGKMIKPGGFYALVVGGNKTNLQEREIVIDTPSLLGKLSESCGWNVDLVINLDTYHRYNVHQKNSIRTEVLLLLRKEFH